MLFISQLVSPFALSVALSQNKAMQAQVHHKNKNTILEAQQQKQLYLHELFIYIFIEIEKQVHKLIAFLAFLHATCVYHDIFFLCSEKRIHLSTAHY